MEMINNLHATSQNQENANIYTSTISLEQIVIDPSQTFSQKKQRQGSRRSTYVRSIADELTEEDLLVAIESVDDQAEELVDLSLEGERLRIRHYTSRNEGGRAAPTI